MKAVSSVFSPMSSIRGFILIALLSITASLPAQEPDSTMRVRMIGIGTVNILDTYLSPENYTGTEIRYVSITSKPSRWNRLRQRIIHQGDVSVSHNHADNNNEMAGFYNFQYGLTHGWMLTEDLYAWVGGSVDATLGFVYNMRNSNNPAQAKVALNLAPMAGLTYKFSIKHRPFSLNYEATAPLCGLMFSPNYGQSYYEIFNRGNYDHNIVPTTLISTPSLRQLLTLEFPLLRRKFRIGYLGDYQQAKVNHLKYHNYTHALVVGMTIWRK